MISKLFGLGATSGKEGHGNSHRSSSLDRNQSGSKGGNKKGAAMKKVDKYMEEAFKAEFDDDLTDQKNISH